jgi:SAM-dependent methyltransferase
MLYGGTGVRAETTKGRVQRQRWNNKVARWNHHLASSPELDRVRQAILRDAAPVRSDRVVDLGAGTGFLALAFAPLVRDILCVDVAEAMLDELQSAARRDGHDNVTTRCCDISVLELPPASVDIVVSNYALHHLSHADKAALLRRAHGWLRPGGRILIGDWMMGPGLSQRDRRLLVGRARRMIARGPRGVWRLLRAGTQFALGRGRELPAAPAFWEKAMRRAGFADVRFEGFDGPAGLVVGRVPR